MTVSIEVSLGAKLGQAEGSVELHVDLSLLHSCTFFSFVTELVCALNHSSNAFALAQDCHKTELPLSCFLSFSTSL